MSKQNWQAFPIKLMEIRKDRGFSQQNLADIIGLSVGCIAAIEQGRRKPLLITAVRIAEALNVSIDDLLEF